MANAVTGAELHSFLRSCGYEIREGRKGPLAIIDDGPDRLDGTRPDPIEVRLPADSKKCFASQRTLGHVARAIGETPKGLRVLLDRELTGAKPAHIPVLPSVPGATRAEAVGAIVEPRALFDAFEKYIRCGLRGPHVYGRALEIAAELKAILEDAPRDVEGEYEAPSDKGYRPSQRDPLEHGPARVTGLTATAAKQRKTYTRWEHREHTDGGAA